MKLKRYKQFVRSVNEDREAPRYDSIDDFRREMDDMDMPDDTLVQDEPVRRRGFNPDEEGSLTDVLPADLDRYEDPGAYGVDPDETDFDVHDKFASELPGDSLGDVDLPDYVEDETKLHDLAKMLGTDVRDNQVKFGDHTVNYYSETGNLHIGSKEFETAEDAAEFLQGGQARVLRDTNESKSYRFRNRKK